MIERLNACHQVWAQGPFCKAIKMYFLPDDSKTPAMAHNSVNCIQHAQVSNEIEKSRERLKLAPRIPEKAQKMPRKPKRNSEKAPEEARRPRISSEAQKMLRRCLPTKGKEKGSVQAGETQKPKSSQMPRRGAEPQKSRKN